MVFGRVAENSKGRTKIYTKAKKIGEILQLDYFLGEDSEFPCLYEVFVLPRKKQKGEKK